MTENGESNGYLAGGGPGYKGLIDKPKLDREESAPKVFTPDKSHAIQTRKHEGIPSIAVSPGGKCGHRGTAEKRREKTNLITSF